MSTATMETNNQNLVDSLVNQITTTNSIATLHTTLRGALRPDIREAALGGALSSGADPLNLLDLRTDTLGVLYILSARLNVPSFEVALPVPLPAWEVVENFCSQFIPEQARHAPERMFMLGDGILKYAAHLLNPKWAIIPLLNLVLRFLPTPNIFTPIHYQLLLTSLQTGHVGPVAPFLVKYPIDDIYNTAHYPGYKSNESPTTDLSYNDNLMYHYMAGIALTLAALPLSSELNPSADLSQPSTIPPPPPNFRLLTHALSYFETCITAPCASPNTPPSALQFEALKKLRLLQCIRYGGPKPLPKYTHPALSRLWKSSGTLFQPGLPVLPREERNSGGYAAFVQAFPGNIGSISNTSTNPTSSSSVPMVHPIRTLALRDRTLYEHDKNWGLILRVVAEAESGRWQVKQLTESYVRLGLSEIGKALGWIRDNDPAPVVQQGDQSVRALLLQMIESKTINASISADDIVTFHDNDPDVELEELLEQFGEPPAGQSSHTLSSVLTEIQNQTAQLQILEEQTAQSKRFLTQVVKNIGSGGGSAGFPGGYPQSFMMGGGASWVGDDEEGPLVYGHDDSMYS
ncbi:hypothetical protein E1B28_012639 [Marasmius oreades]|uniref:COP9 signalosome complex subunit 3 N-terminal helical repeats domain-containing protein n=1 Tax=Marasmius oreades TaxID=181124 RepID=A0A9P7UNG6_9AGAR|nr:uncharacterized protein E1B28_012639 [Marasmius oreades]KAG7088667.1 hypothetical protein E1B28_012639 [Marasmius oreades]